MFTGFVYKKYATYKMKNLKKINTARMRMNSVIKLNVKTFQKSKKILTIASVRKNISVLTLRNAENISYAMNKRMIVRK